MFVSGKTLLHFEASVRVYSIAGALWSSMWNLVIQQNDSVSLTLSTPFPRHAIWAFFTKVLLTDKYDLLTVRISFIPVLIRDHQTRLLPCGPSHHLGGIPPMEQMSLGRFPLIFSAGVSGVTSILTERLTHKVNADSDRLRLCLDFLASTLGTYQA